MDAFQDGRVVHGVVSAVHHYGIEAECDGRRVLVLIPEIAWGSGIVLEQRFAVSDPVSIKILRYVEQQDIHVGSIRELDVAGNPYLALERLTGTRVRAQVKYVHEDSVTIVLPGVVWETVPRTQLAMRPRPGDEFDVRIEHVDVTEKRVRVTVVPA